MGTVRIANLGHVSTFESLILPSVRRALIGWLAPELSMMSINRQYVTGAYRDLELALMERRHWRYGC